MDPGTTELVNVCSFITGRLLFWTSDCPRNVATDVKWLPVVIGDHFLHSRLLTRFIFCQLTKSIWFPPLVVLRQTGKLTLKRAPLIFTFLAVGRLFMIEHLFSFHQGINLPELIQWLTMIWNDDDPDLFGWLYGWLLCIFHLLQLIPSRAHNYLCLMHFSSPNAFFNSLTMTRSQLAMTSSYLTGSTSTSKSQSEASVTCVIAFLWIHLDCS